MSKKSRYNRQYMNIFFMMQKKLYGNAHSIVVLLKRTEVV